MPVVRTDGLSGGRSVDVRSRDYQSFFGWVEHFTFLPMVLRWRASRARAPLSIDKITWSLTIFIDFDFYLLVTQGSNYTWNWCYFERVADLNREKHWRLKTWPISAIRTLKRVLKKRKYFFQVFFLSTNIVWSFNSQLLLNCQQIHCLHESGFHFRMNRRALRCIFRYKWMESVKSR